MPVNREMFAEIDKLITAFPELHRQNYWQEDDTEATGSCGTTRCVAGWAVWLKAKEMGLVTRKRDYVALDVLYAVAEHLGINTKDGYGARYGQDRMYMTVGARLLGLNKDKAHALFMNMSDDLVAARVKSYAEAGEGNPDKEIAALR
jgi:hypothetical protein